MNLTMTPAAEKFIRRLLRFDGGPGAGFRLKVSPGGCSGLAADFTVAPALEAGEQAFAVNGVTLFLGAESRLLLDGVTIDFADTPLQSGFVFQDPKHVACGHSAPVLVSLDALTTSRGTA
jgi:iron-sulfur cluster assembly accessory protein